VAFRRSSVATTSLAARCAEMVEAARVINDDITCELRRIYVATALIETNIRRQQQRLRLMTVQHSDMRRRMDGHVVTPETRDGPSREKVCDAPTPG
jgi:hypothetical protein